MRRAIRTKSVLLAAVVLVGAACQADADDDAGVGEPIEEPTSVTEPEPTTDDSDGEDTADDTSDSTTDDDTRGTTTAPTTSSAPTTAPTATEPPPASSTLPEDVFATTTPAKAEPVPAPATETVYEVGMIDNGLAPFVTMASDDLAERLGVSADSIEVLTAVLVTWPDGALGCPEPDRAYAQVVTDGSVIELGVDGRVYRYHTGGAQTPFPCDRPLNPVPSPA